MSDIPIAIEIEVPKAITVAVLRTCRRCGFLFNIDNPYNANQYKANQYRCKKCLAAKNIMKDLVCIIN